MYWVYSTVYALALAVSSPYWIVQMFRSGKYRAGLAERFGRVPSRLRLPSAAEDVIWVHAVSVGEVLAIAGVVHGLRKRSQTLRVVVSTTTLTGQKIARERFGQENVFYLPLDLPATVNAYLRALRPRLLVIAETEFWPNLLSRARRSGATIAIVNARISDRSFPGYRRFRRLLTGVLKNVDTFLAQSDTDRERLIAIGADAVRVQVAGNLKFDFEPPAETQIVAKLRAVLETKQKVVVFGSTVQGEEELLLPCFRAVFNEFPNALLILAPRHPERFDAVTALLKSNGIQLWRRSDWDDSPIGAGVFLLDSVGELASLYSLADAAFVGGSLVPRGGHNILEPAYFAKATIVGPHYENFRDIVETFKSRRAVIVSSATNVSGDLVDLLKDPARAEELGSGAQAVVAENRGSTARTIDLIMELLQYESAHEMLPARQS